MRVAVIVDIRGWALDHIAHAIKRWNPEPGVELDILYQVDLQGEPKDALRVRMSEYDVVYPFCEFQAAFLLSKGITSFITTVHMGPVDGGVPPGEVPEFDRYWAHLRDAGLAAERVSVISPLLEKLWRPQRAVSSVRVGVDPVVFHPRGEGVQENKKLRVGWVGNPDKPYKKYELVRSAVAKAGDAIEFDPILWTPESGARLKTHPEMADYFRSLDLYVCMSDHEGLPTPGIEAAMCGVPIASVRVGVMPELIVPGANGFLIDQDPEQLALSMIWAAEHRDELRTMRTMMAEQAYAYLSWETRVYEWIEFITGDSDESAE